MLRWSLISFPATYVHFSIAMFQMFAVPHISPCRCKNTWLFIAIFQMFTVWHMFREGVNNMFSFIYQYFKCSLFLIYSLVRVNNMCTFIQQYFRCLHLIYPQTGKKYLHFYSNISNVYYFAYIPVSE